MDTRLYLDNSKLFECSSTVVELVDLEESARKHGRYSIETEASIFHPQGGGQPSDKGCIKCGDSVMDVRFVQANPVSQRIVHMCELQSGSADEFKEGSTVELHVDATARLLHARLHSAGHAIDTAMLRAGLYDKVRPAKGYHFTDAPYVEFEGELSEETIAAMPDLLNEQLGLIVAENLSTTISYLSREDAAAMCGGDLTSYPETVRVVDVAGHPCPCGGTHVENTSELGKVVVTKVKRKKRIIKVSYVLQ